MTKKTIKRAFYSSLDNNSVTLETEERGEVAINFIDDPRIFGGWLETFQDWIAKEENQVEPYPFEQPE
jgi:hypothetical protein